MNSADFDYVRAFIREQSAISLEPGKEYLVESRLRALARKENFTSIEALIDTLRSDPNKTIHSKVVDAMTTNETSFFRDIHPFDTLRKHVLPGLISRRANERRLDIWCGAASTGQEPYSVLMLIATHFPELLTWNLEFLATDLCAEVLNRARAGRFSQLEINRGLPASLLVKYFVRQGNEWEIREDFRKRIQFREFNLVKEWPALPMFDLIFLRNVMIYFDLETKKEILANMRRRLKPGGLLLLGAAETTQKVDDAFESVIFDKTTFYRLKST
jgi:chemotaxis protein methyltransferase CheR